MNRAWHQLHPMPRQPTRQQRIDWHAAHAEACGCRSIPESLKAEVEQQRVRATAEGRGETGEPALPRQADDGEYRQEDVAARRGQRESRKMVPT